MGHKWSTSKQKGF